MATLTADRPFLQHSLLDPHEEDRAARMPQPPATPSPTPASAGRPDADIPAAADPARAAAGRVQTLDDLVAGTWDQLVTSHAATCFVCGGDVAPRWSAGPRPVGGRCTSCGSELS
jgi:hypothetical protein